MDKRFHKCNREAFYKSLEQGAVAALFSGTPPRKTNDEYYPFFADRSFVYMTGVDQQDSVLLGGASGETLYIPPSDELAERWNGKRITADEAAERSGADDIKPEGDFIKRLDYLFQTHQADTIYLNLYKHTANEPDGPSHRLAAYIKGRYPHIIIKNALPQIKKQRLIKQPCEITAMREAEEITRDGILAMMRASRAGMYEYQYKAEFDYALAQRGSMTPAFPPIISVGANNFFIHYHEYTGQARDGDFVLNDVGAWKDNVMNDVSRGWPVNGRFTEKQRILYQCAYETSNHMFGLIKPGMAMGDVDLTIRKYNYERLKDIGLCRDYNQVGKYMWHGGAHHVGYDVHDVVAVTPETPLAPGMVFCVDIGIYCQEWGIGFRLEDNCLVTENGCENLSAVTPRSIEDIEGYMGR